ncbi:MAG: hypothetical protein L6Q75_06175 [Burkholderiaceae bacterium]|nr:hypothetical protein [Burkholderiaceae bacterium]
MLLGRTLWVLGALFVSLLGIMVTPAIAQESTLSACSVAEPPKNCEDNMWALRVAINAPNGAYVHVPDPGCMNDSAAEIQKALQAAAASASPKLALFSGPISKLAAQPIAQAMKSQGGDIGKLFSPYAKNGALCAPLVAVVPVEADVIGFRLLAGEASGGLSRCSPGADCPIGWSKFQTTPVQNKAVAMRTYSTVFMNWSHDRARRAEMLVFYKLPKGEKPLQEM